MGPGHSFLKLPEPPDWTKLPKGDKARTTQWKINTRVAKACIPFVLTLSPAVGAFAAVELAKSSSKPIREWDVAGAMFGTTLAAVGICFGLAVALG